MTTHSQCFGLLQTSESPLRGAQPSMSILTTDELELLKTLGFVPSVLTPGQWSKMVDGLQMAKLVRTPSGSWEMTTWVLAEGSLTYASSLPRKAPFKSETVGPLLTWAHVEGLI